MLRPKSMRQFTDNEPKKERVFVRSRVSVYVRAYAPPPRGTRGIGDRRTAGAMCSLIRKRRGPPPETCGGRS
jgi:hypothetical protein